jgi:regulator of sigma E protease
MSVLISIASIAVVLGVLVFVHEFGHYAVAKLCGVRVEIFSLGFGKRLWGFRRGDTDYRISLLPVGGYVKMAGENPMEARSGDPGEFTSHPRWQRFLIAIAGPAANIILTLAVLTGVFMVHHERPIFAEQPASIGWVLDDSAAQHAGLIAGDKIVRIQNFQNPTWEDVVERTVLNPGQPVQVDIQRGQETLHKTVTPKPGRDQMGEVGWIPQSPAMVNRVDPTLPAAKAGIEPGDEIVAINGVENATALSPLLQINKEKPVQLTILRHGQRLNFNVTPEYVDDPANPGGRKYRIGIEIGEVTVVDRLPFGSAITLAVDESKKQSGFVFQLLGKMFERPSTVKSFSSPIGMAKYAGQAAMEKGWTPLLSLMALISLQLALFNLLPIPILDGGLMLMLLIESLMRRDIKIEIKERVYQAAFVFLMLFAAVVIYNDVLKQLHG